MSEIAPTKAGIPQGGILSPFLFNIYVADQPTMQQTIVADYADDKAILSINEDPLIPSTNLQVHCPSGVKNGESKLTQTNLYTQRSH